MRLIENHAMRVAREPSQLDRVALLELRFVAQKIGVGDQHDAALPARPLDQYRLAMEARPNAPFGPEILEIERRLPRRATRPRRIGVIDALWLNGQLYNIHVYVPGEREIRV